MKMIHSARNIKRCPYGCCGSPPKQGFLGPRASIGKEKMLRSLKKKDRQRGYQEIQSQQD